MQKINKIFKMKPLSNRSANQICNFKLILILYTILVINIINVIQAAPTTNSPSKLSPSMSFQQLKHQQHNQNIELLLSEEPQPQQSNGDNFDQIEISTTTIPIESIVLNKILATKKPELIQTTTTTTNDISTSSSDGIVTSSSGGIITSSSAGIVTSSSEGIVTSSSAGIVTSSSEGIPTTTFVSTSMPSTIKSTSLLPLLTTEKPIQKSRKLKTRLGKKLKEKPTTSKYVEPASIAKIVTADTVTTKQPNKSNEDVNIRKLFEKSTTTTATTTGMTTENLDSQSTIQTASDTTTLNSIVATTNAVPIVIDYLTTTQTNPFDELLNLNDQKVEEALQLVKNTFRTTDKLAEPNKITEQVVNAAKEDELQGNKIIPAEYSSAASSSSSVSDNTKFLNANEEKKLKHYENKKSHMAYKKKLRQKLRNYNHSKMITDKKEIDLLTKTTTTTSTSVPISSTTNDITNPIFLPTTNEASVVSISTSSADPFSKLNTKTVNPFRHQDAIDDISVSDTVSATTLETTTVETPLAMASATSTQQTTSADTFQLKIKQSSSISSLLSDNNEDDNDRIDDSIPKYISTSDDLITTYSTQLQSSSSSQSSTVQPSLSFIKSQLQTSTKDSLLLTTTELLTNDSTTNNTLNKIVTTQETLITPIVTTTTKNSETDDTLSSLTSLSSTEKELISISTSNPIFTYNPTPLRGTTKSYETSSSPTTFMARDQLKYTDDDGSNIELVTTKFITDYPKFSSKNIDNNNNKNIMDAVSSVKHENTKLPEMGKLKINTPTSTISFTSTTEPPPLIYEHKNRIEAINEYKTINSKKLNNKDNSAIVNDNNENANFNTLVQMKDILPYKITVADLSTTAPSSSVSTQEKNISNENEYTISTKIPTVTTTIPTFTIDTRSKENTFYSTLKNTFRSVHTTTGSSLEKDISILDTGLEENTPLASTTTATTTSDKTEKEKEEVSSGEEQTTTIKEIGSENNFFTTFPPQTTTTAAVTETIFSTEKLIKLTDVENIDSAELIKTDIIAKNISDINRLIFSTKPPNKDNSTTVQTSIGHDGLKATKKKQLLYKHFKTLTDKDDDSDTSIVPEHKLGPLRMKETVLKPKTEESVTETVLNIGTTENIKVKTIESNTTRNSTDVKATDFKSTESPVTTSSSVESSTSPKSSAETENDSTVMLDIDLISDNSKPESSSFFYDSIYKLKPAPTVQPKTTTESDYIKHKNYEKSLIPKLEWIPIASVEHFDFTDFSRSTTINYPSSTDENERKAKLAVQLSADANDSQTKSIEIELVEPTKSDKQQQHQSEVVPEFFEISKLNSPNPNIKTGDKENSESSPIEIQINVSEGFGNENENLEFSFRQMHSENAFKPIKVAHTMQNPPPGFQEIGEITIQRSVENQSADSVTVKPIMSVVHTNGNKSRNQDSNSNKNNEPEEILQVEITAIDNSTGIESFNEPKFTLHSETNLNRNRDNDDFFIPDLKLEAIDELKEESKPLDNLNKDNVDRDSDTIFYISNTEVKVAESKPTPNSLRNSDIDSIPEIYLHRNKTAAEINRSKLESQFFPTIYEEDVRIDVSKNRNATNNQKQQEPEHYEEDIILSPLKSNFDPLKMEINSQRNNNDNSMSAANSDNLYPLSSSAADVSYVGETLIEIEESTNANPAIPPLDLITYSPLSGSSNDLNPIKKDTDVPLGMIIAGESAPIDDMNGDNTSGALLSDVIIQPAVIPEMSIGVPVIGELPPQIELKEIDYIPSSTNNGGGSGGKNQQITEQIDGGAIQYGGDLISDDDTSGSAGSRYVFESSYPFGDERIRKVGRLRNEQNFDNDASDIDDNDSNSSSRDDDGFNSSNRRNVNKIGTNPSDNINANNDDSNIPQQQIVMHALNSNFQKEQFIADFPSYDTLKEIPQKRNNPKKNIDSKINLDSNNSKNHTQEIINLTTTQQISTNNLYNTTTIGQVYGNGSTGNTTEPEQLGNATAFIIMDDAEGNIFDLTDIQTLLIACFATLIPLVLSLLLAFAVRYLWKKYRRDEDPDEEGGLVGDTSIDPMASKSGGMSQDELRTTESGYTLNRSNDTLDTNATDLDGVANGNAGNLNGGKIMANHCTGGSGGGTGGGTINTNNNSCGANGSVTTMTLKNNHLIVETEERNDISRDARETKMHYNSSDKDGVFVVEVARGADTTGAPNSPYKENHIGQKACSIDVDNSKMNDCKIISKNAASNHEEVQIHQPPSDNFDNENPIAIAKSATISELDEANFELEERGINIGNSKTGLSQSDLSSSSNDSNKGYNYGKQELYTTDVKISSTSLKPKLSSDSLDSIKDKSENDFGDNCDTETSPYSREYSNDSGRNKEHKNKDNCNDSSYKNNSNSTSNMDKCESNDGPADVIIEKADAKNPSQNEMDIKPNSKDNGNDLKLDDEKNEKDNLKIIVENHCTADDDEKNIKIENESINITINTNPSSNKNSETIDTNDSLPPPPPSPPQLNKEISISSNNQQSDGQKEIKEIEKENENEKIEDDETKNDNILNSSTTVSTTESQPEAIPIVKEIELENKIDDDDDKTNEKNNVKIIHHGNGFDDNHQHQHQPENHDDNKNNSINSNHLTNGHYEKQNGIIHNNHNNDNENDNDFENDDDDNNDDETIIVNDDDKKMNGCINEDPDRTLSVGGGQHENGFDSILSLPDPPSTEEINKMNDIILMENSQLDSLPPPPPLDTINTTITTTTNGDLIGNCNNNNDDTIKNSISIGNCGIDNNIKNLLNGEHTTITTLTEDEQQQKQHQNGIIVNGTPNGTTTTTSTLVAVNGSS